MGDEEDKIKSYRYSAPEDRLDDLGRQLQTFDSITLDAIDKQLSKRLDGGASGNLEKSIRTIVRQEIEKFSNGKLGDYISDVVYESANDVIYEALDDEMKSRRSKIVDKIQDEAYCAVEDKIHEIRELASGWRLREVTKQVLEFSLEG